MLPRVVAPPSTCYPRMANTALLRRLLREFLPDLLARRHAAGVVQCGEIHVRNHRATRTEGSASALVVHDGCQFLPSRSAWEHLGFHRTDGWGKMDVSLEVGHSFRGLLRKVQREETAVERRSKYRAPAVPDRWHEATERALRCFRFTIPEDTDIRLHLLTVGAAPWGFPLSPLQGMTLQKGA